MSLIWTAGQREAVARHGERGYPDEICGLLLGEHIGADRVVRDVVPADNVWDDLGEHRRRFRIAPEVYLREERRARAAGWEIVGFYHSHPDHPARPSETDREHAWPTYSYVIQSVAGGRAAAICSWRLNDDRFGYEQEALIEQDNSQDNSGEKASTPAERVTSE